MVIPETGFGNQPNFNADISQWNVSQATNMYAMFWSARSFNQPIGSWDISNVKNTWSMFASADSFNQAIGSLEHSASDTYASMFRRLLRSTKTLGVGTQQQVTDMQNMFYSLLRSTTTFPRGLDPQRRRRKLTMFTHATAFQAKFKCTNAVTGPANSCVGPSPIPDASWHAFVGDCLMWEESPVIAETGECIDWARSKDVWYGTMPNWDVSLVDGYEWMDWKCFSRLWRKKYIRRRHFEVGHRESDYYVFNVL